jgi:hypothetical protein
MFKLNFDFIRDIVPVASIVRVPLVINHVDAGHHLEKLAGDVAGNCQRTPC